MEIMCGTNGMCGVNKSGVRMGMNVVLRVRGDCLNPREIYPKMIASIAYEIYEKITRKIAGSGVGHVELGPGSLQGLCGS